MSIPFASVVFVFSLFLYFPFSPLFYGNIPNDTKSRKMIVTFSDVLLTWHNSVMCITVGVAFRIYNRKMFDIVQILEVDGMELVFFVLMQSGCNNGWKFNYFFVSFLEENVSNNFVDDSCNFNFFDISWRTIWDIWKWNRKNSMKIIVVIDRHI